MRVNFSERDGDIFFIVTREEAKKLASIDPDHSFDPLFCEENGRRFSLTVGNVRLDSHDRDHIERFYVVESIWYPPSRPETDVTISTAMCQELIHNRPCGDRYKSQLYDSPKVGVYIED